MPYMLGLSGCIFLGIAVETDMHHGGLLSQIERVGLPTFALSGNVHSIIWYIIYACAASGLCRAGVTAQAWVETRGPVLGLSSAAHGRRAPRPAHSPTE